jgi:hypothetical protein
MPEWIPKLREEAKMALQRNNGGWQHDSLKELRHLDGFFKESQRFNTPSFCKLPSLLIKIKKYPSVSYLYGC